MNSYPVEGGKEMNANPENLTALVLVSQGQAERHELARMVEEEARCRQEALQIVIHCLGVKHQNTACALYVELFG